MSVEGRGWVTCIGIVRVNGQPEELDGLGGRRQPSMGGTSRVSREAQARFREGLCQEDAKASCCTEDEGRSFGAAL